MTYKAREAYQQDDVALDYDSQRFNDLKGRLVDRREKELIYKAIRLTKIDPPAKVLDIPSGTGRLSHYLARKGFRVVGVDISAAMIEQGNEKISNSNGSVTESAVFQVGDAEALSFPDSCFDIAVSLRLFGHLPTDNRVRVLGELTRVSKSFVVVSYHLKHCVQGLLRTRRRERKGVFWNSVTHRQIDDELEEAGLERAAKLFLLAGVSETVIVLGRKKL